MFNSVETISLTSEILLQEIILRASLSVAHTVSSRNLAGGNFRPPEVIVSNKALRADKRICAHLMHRVAEGASLEGVASGRVLLTLRLTDVIDVGRGGTVLIWTRGRTCP